MLPPPIVHVIDDESDVCLALASLLDAAGHNIRCYSSGEEFFEKFDPAIPGCIIADVCMPGMSGITLQERLVQSNVSIPVIILGNRDRMISAEPVRQ